MRTLKLEKKLFCEESFVTQTIKDNNVIGQIWMNNVQCAQSFLLSTRKGGQARDTDENDATNITEDKK